MAQGEHQVMELVPMARIVALIAGGLAVLSLIATVILADHPLQAVVFSVVFAVVWSLLVLLGQRWILRMKPPPRVVTRSELPTIKRTRAFVVRTTILLGVFDAGTTSGALSTNPQEYFIVGFALGVFILSFASYRWALQTQRIHRETVWISTEWLWTTKARAATKLQFQDAGYNQSLIPYGDYPVNSWVNTRGQRSWLQQEVDGGGWALCMTGNADSENVPGPYTDPESIYLSSNYDGC